jgi:hypothetical protein
VRITAAARTTPGRLGLVTAALLVLSLAFGLAAAAGLQRRSDALRDLVTSSEPLAVAAQDIYRSLSDADATAASAFLEGGVEPDAVRRRYESDIAQAGSALAAAASAASSSDQAGRSVTELSTYLPVYTGLVEAARANNRRGLPVGSAYLREASGLMRATLLPAAASLYESETERLAGTQRRASPLPTVELVLALLALGALVAAQVYLRRRTNRVLNVGLLAATAGVAVALLWTGVVAMGVAVNVNQAREHGSDQVRELARARIAALQARGDETLTLVLRGSGQEYEKSYTAEIGELGGEDGSGGLLRGARDSIADPAVRALVGEAVEQQQRWRAAHAEIRRLDDSGEYNRAVVLAIGDSGAGPAFTAVDDKLGRAIMLSKQRFDAEVAAARSMTAWSVAGAAVLSLLAATAAVSGMWQRLKEYR